MADPTRRKLRFSDDSAMADERVDHIAGLRLDFTDQWGPKAILDLTFLSNRPNLGRALALALSELCEIDGSINRLSTARTYPRCLMTYFVRFLESDEADGHIRVMRAEDVSTEILGRFLNWLDEAGLKPKTVSGVYSHVAYLFRHLKEFHPKLVDPTLNPPQRSNRRAHLATDAREPYSDREAYIIEQAARSEIRKTVLRLTRTRDEVLAKGVDPRSTADGWTLKENAVWYVQNVLGGRYATMVELYNTEHTRLQHVFFDPEYPYSRSDVYAALYPLLTDLFPFLILLGLKTGLNQQALLDLRRDCLRAVPETDKIGITYTKYKTGAQPKIHMGVFPDRGDFDPGGIVRQVLRLTDPVLPFVPEQDRDSLWICLISRANLTGFRKVESLMTVIQGVKGLAKRHDLKTDDGDPLNLLMGRMRPTRLTKRYKAGGHLASVSKNDAKHSRTSTTIPYVKNEETRDIHERTVEDAQRDFFEAVKGKVLLQSPESEVEVEQAAAVLGTSPERAASILNGEQDVFVAACKDFLNRPGGPPNTPCDRPFACFSCKNACWTSRTLPRLLRFLEFTVQQRNLLSAHDWDAKFGVPYRIATLYILPSFPSEVVEVARLAAPGEVFYAPVELKAL